MEKSQKGKTYGSFALGVTPSGEHPEGPFDEPVYRSTPDFDRSAQPAGVSPGLRASYRSPKTYWTATVFVVRFLGIHV